MGWFGYKSNEELQLESVLARMEANRKIEVWCLIKRQTGEMVYDEHGYPYIFEHHMYAKEKQREFRRLESSYEDIVDVIPVPLRRK